DQGDRSGERGVGRARPRCPGLAAGPGRTAVGERVQRPAAARHRLPGRRRHPGRLPGRHGGVGLMTDLATLLEVGGPVAALGGGAAYARARHPGVYWSTVGLPVSTVRLLSSYSSVMEACGLTVARSEEHT